VTPSVSEKRYGAAPAVLTFDLEEWFCLCGEDFYGDPARWESFEPRVEKLTAAILEALSPGGHRATFFVLGWVALRYPALVSEIARKGHEVAFHGMFHRRRDEMTLDAFRGELRAGKTLLEDLSGQRVAGYRAAAWSISTLSDPALEVLAEEGFLYDASVTPVPVIGRRSNPCFPVELRFGARSLIEFPPLSGRGWFSTVLFGGGWAFRQLRFSRLMRRSDEFRARGSPAVFAFHPWEFDSDHPPMTGVPALHRLTHFAHAGRLPKRFARLLARERMHAFRDLL
jgi:polysaccharide deacetylase family protein (PEP-CTERM system associated)